MCFLSLVKLQCRVNILHMAHFTGQWARRLGQHLPHPSIHPHTPFWVRKYVPNSVRRPAETSHTCVKIAQEQPRTPPIFKLPALILYKSVTSAKGSSKSVAWRSRVALLLLSCAGSVFCLIYHGGKVFPSYTLRKPVTFLLLKQLFTAHIAIEKSSYNLITHLRGEKR